MKLSEKIIQLLDNPLVTCYGMEIMSNGRIHLANFQRYRNRMKKVENSFVVFERMSKKVKQLFFELAEEVITKEVKNMTGLEVIEVNVNVVDIKTEEQHEEDSVSLQDKVGEATESVSNFASEQTEKAKELASKAKELTESRVK
ncbi:hypothetical protein IBQ15_002692 [Enterococcus faecalis]|nr:hypothetical protein [Enterococcus faecalis]